MDDASSTSSSGSSDSPTEGVGAIASEEVSQKDASAEVSFSGGLHPPPLAYKSKGYPCPISPEIASSAKKCLWEVDREQVDRSLNQELNRIYQEDYLVNSAKYNFDFNREKELKGRWTWEIAADPPKFYQIKEIGQKGSKRKRDHEEASSSSEYSAGTSSRNVRSTPLVKDDRSSDESSSTVPLPCTTSCESSVAALSSTTSSNKRLRTEGRPPDIAHSSSQSSESVSGVSISTVPADSSLKISTTSVEPMPSSASVESSLASSSPSSTEPMPLASSSLNEPEPTRSSSESTAQFISYSSFTAQTTATTNVSQTPSDVISSSGDSHLTTVTPVTETASSSDSPSSSSAQNRPTSQSGLTIPATSFYQSTADPPVTTSIRRSSPGSTSSPSTTTTSSHLNLSATSRSSNGSSSSSSSGSSRSRNRHSPSSQSNSRRSTTSSWLKYFR